MPLPAASYLPDRPRPAWFGVALSVLFVALILSAFAGIFRTPRVQSTTFEKREAAESPAFPRTLGELRTYPVQLERFLDDRFGLRQGLVRLDHFAKAIVFGVSPVTKVLIGKSGWLYFKGEDTKAFDQWYRGIDGLSAAQVAALREEWLKRSEFLASRGIPFLLVIVPEKYSVYPEFLPSWAVPVTAETALDHIVSDLKRYPQLNVIDLRGALRAAKATERVYYQTDSHWNYLGAMIGYAELMREAMRLVPGLTVAPAQRPPYAAGVDYYSGDLSQMLGLPKQLREEDIAPLGKILATPQTRCAQRDTAAETAGIEVYVYRCPNAPPFTALVYRDSNAIPLIPMLAENFSRSTFVSSAQLDAALVERLKPDIVVEEMVERTLTSAAALPMKR
ncbi:MAG TPA: hypothetical protein VKG21_15655 [Casimicrobiaceae bacterium]|nr:hypothetical protein [Casimicrobiaceae bacterium]